MAKKQKQHRRSAVSYRSVVQLPTGKWGEHTWVPFFYFI
ncbi:hypothetical protein MPNT_10132 [Candidatus Methylacidithermus pantelleriae]|uniref:Uncharacterized protein n=1 Tax=Candidatus Methylacidithermus pantelleriae TaxID=2744239 RepID=A0A8J2BK37_9BACT|nr:hypothetical protein MPNT_10132 [Candidatus Methylacidithermus pantelleriae]